MIAIIDYGMGNLRSVQKAFEYLGNHAVITDDVSVIQKADKVVLPGVGAYCDAMKTITQKGIDKVLYDIVEQKKPLLGICLGMQMFFDISHETISTITDRVIGTAQEWQNRPLKKFCTFLFVDCIYVTIRKEMETNNCAVYVVLGYDVNGIKDVLRLWIGESEEKH